MTEEFTYKDPIPRPAVCMRGSRFDAEVLCQGYKNKLIARSCPTREAAKAAAQKVCDEIEAAMAKVTADILDRYRDAEP